MKNLTIKSLIAVATLAASFASQAVVFTCQGTVDSVRAEGQGYFSVAVDDIRLAPRGWRAYIYPGKEYLASQALVADMEGQQGYTHTFVIKNHGSNDTRCMDNNSNSDEKELVAIIRN